MCPLARVIDYLRSAFYKQFDVVPVLNLCSSRAVIHPNVDVRLASSEFQSRSALKVQEVRPLPLRSVPKYGLGKGV